MKLCNVGHSFDYELEKLIRIFLPFEKIEILHNAAADERLAVAILEKHSDGAELTAGLKLNGRSEERKMSVSADMAADEKECELKLAQLLFECFAAITGYRPKWGILTGIRPVKLFLRLCNDMGKQGAEEYFKNEFFVSPDKIELCKKSALGEEQIISLSAPDSFSLYLSVPFCPSRCSYCSFVSHSADRAGALIPQYVELLCRELRETAKIAQKLNLRLETVYMGGGTPTTLTAEQLTQVLGTVNSCFDLSNVREYTVEAGRPDTITREKLMAIKAAGGSRISINPQTMNDNVLENIGRKHTAAQMLEAFALARECGFDNINVDLIAGLPTDTLDSFSDTLDKILALNPESVTVHSLSLKRAATLNKTGEFPEIAAGAVADKMVDLALSRLEAAEILPYYMYRQSKTVGNLENVGYSKAGCEGLYNVYIMDETHTILACGASAVTKLRQPLGPNISRIFNFKYPYEYISRFDEQLERKKAIVPFYEKYRG